MSTRFLPKYHFSVILLNNILAKSLKMEIRRDTTCHVSTHKEERLHDLIQRILDNAFGTVLDKFGN